MRGAFRAACAGRRGLRLPSKHTCVAATNTTPTHPPVASEISQIEQLLISGMRKRQAAHPVQLLLALSLICRQRKNARKHGRAG